SLDELTDWLKANHRLIPGVKDFLTTLAANGVSPVAISNGSRQIAEPMLVHHGVEMPMVANSLEFSDDGSFAKLEFVHNENDGVRKGDLVSAAAQWGYRIVGCAGDSKGDICMAEATAKAGGLVLACEPGGLSDWCQANEGKSVGVADWLEFEDYAKVIRAVQARISNC
ncbi:MAG: haloacid dehalogenase-like hydrolase, partial [Candidatus Obscuribacterales bacterium]|nr:haloacid dehalogenase-like hydrolase [Candidatus Obscuribacterales bacterium]